MNPDGWHQVDTQRGGFSKSRFGIAGIDPLQRTRYGGAGTLEVTLGTTRQCNSLQSLGDIRMAA
jgi:hypothetical protein